MSDLYNGEVDLSGDEARALAMRVIVDHLWLDTDWLRWEDLPHLTERAFMRLDDLVNDAVRVMNTERMALDKARDIDTDELLRQATERD